MNFHQTHSLAMTSARTRGFTAEKMKNNFQVIRVRGHVKWKYHGSDDETAAALTVKRGNFTAKQNLEQLELAEYARGSSPDEVITIDFDFKPDSQNPFWQRGTTGEIFFYSY